MNKITKISFFLLAVLFAACSGDESSAIQTSVDGAVEVRPYASATLTRAATDLDYSTTHGYLTLFYDSYGSNQSGTYKYKSAEWQVESPLYWQDLVGKASVPKYQFFAVAPEVQQSITNGEVMHDQSATPSNAMTSFEKNDLLMAYDTASVRRCLDIVLKHLHSQLLVTLGTVETDDSLTAAALSTATLKISGLYTNYTLSTMGASNAIPAVVAATGNRQDNLIPYGNQIDDYRFIAPAQTIPAGGLTLAFELYNEGAYRHYTWKNPNPIQMDVSAITQIDITINKTGIKAGVISLTDWSTPPSIKGEVTLDVAHNAPTKYAVDSILLWRGRNNNVSKADARHYFYSNGVWTVPTTEHPYYVDDIVATDSFYATSVLSTDPVTSVDDVIGTTPFGTTLDMATGHLNMTFSHLMSHFSIKLVRGEFLSNIVDLTKATVTIENVYEGSMYGCSAVTGGPLKKYTNVPIADFNKGVLMWPQVLGTNTKVIVTVGANTYSGYMSGDTLRAGTKNELILTVSPQAVKDIALTVEDWKVGETFNKTITIDGISTTTATGNVAFVAGDTLDLLANGLSAKYIYESTGWKSASPIYWDDFKQNTSYNFTSLYTPVTKPVGDNDIDYLYGVTSVYFGYPLSLNVEHIMGRLIVDFQTQSGQPAYTDAQVTGSTFTIKKVTKSESVSPSTGVITSSPVQVSSVMNTDGVKKVLIMQPQTFSAGDDFAVMKISSLSGDVTYTVKVPAGGIKIEKGKDTLLHITISKSEIKIDSMTLRDWIVGDSISGDGEIVDD